MTRIVQYNTSKCAVWHCTTHRNVQYGMAVWFCKTHLNAQCGSVQHIGMRSMALYNTSKCAAKSVQQQGVRNGCSATGCSATGVRNGVPTGVPQRVLTNGFSATVARQQGVRQRVFGNRVFNNRVLRNGEFRDGMFHNGCSVTGVHQRLFNNEYSTTGFRQQGVRQQGVPQRVFTNGCPTTVSTHALHKSPYMLLQKLQQDNTKLQ
ncbi:hypothetical protein JTB14_030227 [Gonioctena quinquepunctata]|nr:hypothetical protein JTB14_030227 [Gonioctena quinquepunctata]